MRALWLLGSNIYEKLNGKDLLDIHGSGGAVSGAQNWLEWIVRTAAVWNCTRLDQSMTVEMHTWQQHTKAWGEETSSGSGWSFSLLFLLEHGTYRLVCPRLILIDANKRNIISSDYKLVSRFHMSKLRWQEFWNIDRLASSTLVQYSLSTKLDDKILRNWGVQMCQLMFIYTYFCDDYQIHNLS